MPDIAASDPASPVIIAVATAPERRVVERSDIGTYNIMLLQTGIGPVQVRSMTETIVAVKPAGLISFGTAGGLAADLPAGRLLLPLHVAAEDGQVFSVAKAWHARVCKRFADQDMETGNMVSISQPARDPQHKQKLQTRTGAVAVDMESAELARIALHLSIPFLVVRAIADPHDQALPRAALAALTDRGELHISGLLGQLLRRPGEIAALLRLSANFRAASRTLNACCRTAGEQMCTLGRSPLL